MEDGIIGSNSDEIILIERHTAMVWQFHKKCDELERRN
jgi:hypothetical protein